MCPTNQLLRIHSISLHRIKPHFASAWALWTIEHNIRNALPSVSTAQLLGDIPGHALHEKGLQRQGDGPLVSSQEERALLVPLINR